MKRVPFFPVCFPSLKKGSEEPPILLEDALLKISDPARRAAKDMTTGL